MGAMGVCTSPNGVLGCKSATCPGSNINSNLAIIRSGQLDPQGLKETWNAVASDLTQLFPHEQQSFQVTFDEYEKQALNDTPVVNDIALAEIYTRLYAKDGDINRYDGYIAQADQNLDSNYKYYRASEVAAWEKRKEDYEAKKAILVAERKAIFDEATPYEDKWKNEGRWSRAFLVMNGNGHVHRSMSCDTCFPSTQFAWLPQYSGQSEELLVSDAGEAACSRCFTSAPVDTLRQKSKVQTPEQKLAAAEKAQAKEEREAKKKAVGIWNADGTELKVKSSWSNYAETIKTERTAQIWATDALIDLENWKAKRNDPKWAQDNIDEKITRIEENSEKVIAALAAKRGVTADVVRAELEVKAAKKRKSQGW